MISRIILKCTKSNLIRNQISVLRLKPLSIERNLKFSSFSSLNDKSRSKLWLPANRNLSKIPKTPDLIYIPHVYRWVKNKIKFKYLQTIWDPEFTEGAFIYGTSKAVCRVTEIIHENTLKDLDELLTQPARAKLKELVRNKLTKRQRSIIKINPEDIKILVPMVVGITNNNNEKNVKIGMRILALKWIRSDTGDFKLVLVALQTEFFRDYTKGSAPEWTINAFDVLDCVVLSQVPT